MDYGVELILDIHDCEKGFHVMSNLDKFIRQVAPLMNAKVFKTMEWTIEECPASWYDLPHLDGNSLTAFISTSAITVHAIKQLKKTFINCFTCSTDFDVDEAVFLAWDIFGGKVVSKTVLVRK